jgi:hypothetical protein
LQIDQIADPARSFQLFCASGDLTGMLPAPNEESFKDQGALHEAASDPSVSGGNFSWMYCTSIHNIR